MIVDVEAIRSIRQAEVGPVEAMIGRVKDQLDICPERLIPDVLYGSSPMLDWPVKREIKPHISVLDQAGRKDSAWSRAEFECDAENNQYFCPA